MRVEESLLDDEDGVPHCVSDSESESENDCDCILASLTGVTRRVSVFFNLYFFSSHYFYLLSSHFDVHLVKKNPYRPFTSLFL
jgi:hypothetical protein